MNKDKEIKLIYINENEDEDDFQEDQFIEEEYEDDDYDYEKEVLKDHLDLTTFDEDSYFSAFIDSISSSDMSKFNKLIPFIKDFKKNSSVALRTSVEEGNYEMFKVLLEHSDPKVFDSIPLTLALKYSHFDIAKELIPLSDLNLRKGEALQLAAERNQPDLVKDIFALCNEKTIDECVEDLKKKGKFKALKLIELEIFERDSLLQNKVLNKELSGIVKSKENSNKRKI